MTIGGISLSGADAGNYSFNTTATTTADISKAALIVGATGINKVYDATTVATVSLSDTPIGSDVVNVAYGSASYGDKNAGIGKAVSVGGITLSGADAGNYSFNTSASTTADIAKANLTVGAVGVNKVYDTTTGATVTLTDNHLRQRPAHRRLRLGLLRRQERGHRQDRERRWHRRERDGWPATTTSTPRRARPPTSPRRRSS